MTPRVAHTPAGWTYTFRSSDTGLTQTNVVDTWAVAVRRALRVATRQGRVL